jgi:hypothetical protein
MTKQKLLVDNENYASTDEKTKMSCSKHVWCHYHDYQHWLRISKL